MNMSLRHIAALAAILVGAASFAGCVAEPQPDPESASEENVGDAEEAISNCCSEGSYHCVANNYVVDYAPPGCGLRTKTLAASTCKSHCNNVACVDSGWKNICP